MQITLPDDQHLLERIRAAGFPSVEAYVRRLIEHGQAVTRLSEPAAQSAEDWIRDFEAIFDALPPGNANFDDSRESIYPVR